MAGVKGKGGRPMVERRTPLIYLRDLAHLRRFRQAVERDSRLEPDAKAEALADMNRLLANLGELLEPVISG